VIRRALVLVPLALALVAAKPATTLNAVENELMCDTCNVPLSVAESPRADQERAEIRRLIAQGKTKQQILDTFVSEYGPNVLADPKGGSSATASWLVPAIVLVGAALVISLLVVRWRRKRRDADEPAEPTAPAISAEDEARLERDLALYD
jgi:cytochrome c-type biogenesis protein CcmH